MRALDRLASAEDDLGGFQDAWSDFLIAANGVYSKLKAGAKGHGRSEPWFGRHQRLQTKDPLLRYVHQARNADEHGLKFGTAMEATYTFHGSGEPKALFSPDGKLLGLNIRIQAAKMSLKSQRPVLVQITNSMHGDTFDPPDSHLGEPIDDPYPVYVAGLTILYLQKMIEEAERLVA